MVILAPQAWLAVCCVGLGLFPGFVLRAQGVMVTLPGLQPPGVVVQGGLGMASGLDS